MSDTYAATLTRVGRFTYRVNIRHKRGNSVDPGIRERFVVGRRHAERVAERWLTKLRREYST